MEKYCKYCDTNKPLSGFHKSKVHKDGYNSKCIVCTKTYYSEWKDRGNNREEYNRYMREYTHDKDHDWAVYILPEEHYAGKTNNLYRRLCGHKTHNKNTEGAHIVKFFQTEEEALAYESSLHRKGYKGAYNRKLYSHF